MKKIISVLLCVVLLLGTASFSAFAAKEVEKTEETTEFVLEIDVNKRYTDILDPSDASVSGAEADKKGLSETQKTVYIAVLCAALVVSVVILAVSVKKVPKEEDIDISGKKKIKKDKGNKE